MVMVMDGGVQCADAPTSCAHFTPLHQPINTKHYSASPAKQRLARNSTTPSDTAMQLLVPETHNINQPTNQH